MNRASHELNLPLPQTGADPAPEPSASEAVSWERLVRAAVSGQTGATRRVLSKLVPSVRALCRSVLGADHPELEDAIQESLVELVRALPQFRFESALSHYAVRIALRRAISVKKKYVRDSQRFPLTADAGAELDAASDASSEELVACRRRDLVRGLLTDLSARQAEVVVLRIMLGHSVSEVAEVTGVSANTVKTRLFLAKRTLRRRISRNPEWRTAFDEVIDA